METKNCNSLFDSIATEGETKKSSPLFLPKGLFKPKAFALLIRNNFKLFCLIVAIVFLFISGLYFWLCKLIVLISCYMSTLNFIWGISLTIFGALAYNSFNFKNKPEDKEEKEINIFPEY